jgi:hypothetical protein
MTALDYVRCYDAARPEPLCARECAACDGCGATLDESARGTACFGCWCARDEAAALEFAHDDYRYGDDEIEALAEQLQREPAAVAVLTQFARLELLPDADYEAAYHAAVAACATLPYYTRGEVETVVCACGWL